MFPGEIAFGAFPPEALDCCKHCSSAEGASIAPEHCSHQTLPVLLPPQRGDRYVAHQLTPSSPPKVGGSAFPDNLGIHPRSNTRLERNVR